MTAPIQDTAHGGQRYEHDTMAEPLGYGLMLTPPPSTYHIPTHFFLKKVYSIRKTKSAKTLLRVSEISEDQCPRLFEGTLEPCLGM